MSLLLRKALRVRRPALRTRGGVAARLSELENCTLAEAEALLKVRPGAVDAMTRLSGYPTSDYYRPSPTPAERARRKQMADELLSRVDIDND